MSNFYGTGYYDQSLNSKKMRISNAQLTHRYSSGLRGNKILIIGPIPPPIGGVSMHIARVAEKLKAQNNIIQHLDTARYSSRVYRYSTLIRTLFSFRPDQIHYHTLFHHGLEWLIIWISSIILRTQIVMVEHNCRHLASRSRLFLAFLRFTIPHIHQVVFMGTTPAQQYVEHHICISEKKRSIESPALPPNITELHSSPPYPLELWEFCGRHIPLICISASKMTSMSSGPYAGEDLYGIDYALKLIKELHQKNACFTTCDLLIVLGQQGDTTLYTKLIDTIKNNGLQKSVYILEGNYLLWPLFKQVNLFIRPTRSDSYGISIEEALLENVKVVASDICERPAGTILFESHNYFDFYTAVETTLTRQDPRHEHPDVPSIPINSEHNHMHPQ